MSGAHSRRKQPEVVRRALLNETANLAASEGLAAVTIDAVARAAGVTKGGLFHHFPSRQALLEGVFSEMLSAFDEEVDRLMEADPESAGRFTRAYVEAIFADLSSGASSPWAALAVALLTDVGVREMWSRWFSERLRRHAADDDGMDLSVARLAADGAWYACVLGVEDGFGGRVDEMKSRLVAMTRAG